MTQLQPFMLFCHLLGVIVWVGGMAFAWLCLRPAAAVLAPADRLTLWGAVFQRFFAMVWIAIALTLGSGLVMMLVTGFAHAPPAWHIMMLTGAVMTGVFVSIWIGPWPALCSALAAQDWAVGASALASIRKRVGFNLTLGLITVVVATLGPTLST
ncbi:MAG: CopD family protein [Rhodocyclaceae bacterium]|nr:CopD family protein [Rhodocyclaceae bacterium]MCP5308990.1 CopD family protein [Zoogloeaceae bacterium]